jgi:glycosyltransferase involved in cell wall biosynthesis
VKLGLAFGRLRHGGGMESHARDLIRGFSVRGIRPVAFARSFDPTLPEADLVDHVRIGVDLWPSKLRDHVFSRRFAAARAAAGVDVVVSCARVVGAEVAICGGTHRGHLAASGRAPGLFDRLQIRLERRHYAAAETVIAHSRAMAGELRDLYGLAEEKIRVIHPPVDTGRFRPVDAERRARLRAAFGFDPATTVFAFVSTGHRRKGLDLLRHGFETSDLPIRLAVAGRPIGRPGRNLAELGYVEAIEDLYAAADYTILASTYEPFGLVGVESLLCGTPVVLAGGIGCREVIAPEACLDFDRTRPETLTEALARAAAEAAERRRAVEAGGGLRYDPSIAAHLDQLIEIVERIGRRQP